MFPIGLLNQLLTPVDAPLFGGRAISLGFEDVSNSPSEIILPSRPPGIGEAWPELRVGKQLLEGSRDTSPPSLVRPTSLQYGLPSATQERIERLGFLEPVKSPVPGFLT